MKFTSPEFSHTIQDPTREPTGLTNRYFRNDKTNWSQNASRNCFWHRYWGRASQLLANFFLSLVTVPEVFMKVKWARFSSCF